VKKRTKLVTISIHPTLYEKFQYAKIVESYRMKMNLNNQDFIHLLIEEYDDPPKKKNCRKIAN
jgi:hypothetical protein